MKKIIYSTLALLLVLTACKSDFLDTDPTDAVSDTFVAESVNNGYSVINGMHRMMFTQISPSMQGTTGMSMVMELADVMGEDWVMARSASSFQVRFCRWLAQSDKTNDENPTVYIFLYRLIANANKVLESIDVAPGSDDLRKQVKGEALAFRALAYSYLVQYYGKRYNPATAATEKAVPLLLAPTREPQPRATIAQVYEAINNDLKLADELLSNVKEYKRPNKSHINNYVVKGLRARVALTMGNYEDAKNFAKESRELASKDGLAIMDSTSYYSGFNDSQNIEWMWASVVAQGQEDKFGAFGAYMGWNRTSNLGKASPKCISVLLYNQIKDTDYRKGLWYPKGIPEQDYKDLNISGFTKANYMNKKFGFKDPNTSVGDIMYMRISEMYLIEAESKARLGEADAADVLYTLVSKRDKAYVKSTQTGDKLINEVMLHRRIELWGEGFRWFDLKRLGQGLDRTGSNHVSTVIQLASVIPATSNMWQWSFSQGEEDSNPHIKAEPNP